MFKIVFNMQRFNNCFQIFIQSAFFSKYLFYNNMCFSFSFVYVYKISDGIYARNFKINLSLDTKSNIDLVTLGYYFSKFFFFEKWTGNPPLPSNWALVCNLVITLFVYIKLKYFYHLIAFIYLKFIYIYIYLYSILLNYVYI